MSITVETLERRARKSLHGAEGWVVVDGVGKVYAESFDAEDAFAPAVAGYELRDGFLVYQGRNGSMGVVLGPAAALAKWTRDVEHYKKIAPVLGQGRPWVPTDGGKENLGKATAAARRVFPGIRLRFLTVPGTTNSSGESHMGRATILNAHLSTSTELAGARFHAGSKVAAHEAGHAAFSHDPGLGREVIRVLGTMKEPLTMYHALAGNFEGAMEAAAWWSLDPRGMRDKAPALYYAVSRWLTSRA